MKIRTHKRQCDIEMCPVAVFEQLYAQDDYGFIYESMEHVNERGRYSFIGGRPFIVFLSRGDAIVIQRGQKKEIKSGNPLDVLKSLMSCADECSTTPVFKGGAVGYVGYDVIRFFEKIPVTNKNNVNAPDTYFIFPSEIIVFDHQEKHIDIYTYDTDVARLEQINHVLDCTQEKEFEKAISSVKYQSNFTKQEFCNIVSKAKQYIVAGDIFQVVLSQQFSFPIEKEPLSVYRALRITNPSPYMYYLHFKDLSILGSSPETLIKLHNNTVVSRPIAGTRPRGITKAQDAKLAQGLLHDAKELAEHIMLVDLARNDVGRICSYGSVQVHDLMKIEYYSRVMHITSSVVGSLAPGKNAFDVFAAGFPAGTVSGAPKIRAMEIIDELETIKRGIYAGAIGYFAFDGTMDFCIAIRTIVIHQGTAYIQGGAGIVADSASEKEYAETVNKMSALLQAVEIAP